MLVTDGRGAFQSPVKADRQELLEVLEELMQTRVTIKWARNPFAVSLRFPGLR